MTRARRTSVIGNDRVWKSFDEPRVRLRSGRHVESVSCCSTFFFFFFSFIYLRQEAACFSVMRTVAPGAAASSSKDPRNTGFSVDQCVAVTLYASRQWRCAYFLYEPLWTAASQFNRSFHRFSTDFFFIYRKQRASNISM